MSIDLTPTGGRYPHDLAHYDTRNIRASLECLAGIVMIRIDDILNIDRWEELSIDLGVLRSVLQSEERSIPGEEEP